MRRLALLTLLAFALATAGCTEAVSETMTQLRGDGGHPEPYYEEYRERVGLDHNKTFRVPVETGASALLLGASLSNPNDSSAAPLTATLTLTVRDPNGQTIDTRTLDHTTQHVTLAITPAMTGIFEVHIAGTGAPRTGLEPVHTEPEYLLTTEVTYS